MTDKAAPGSGRRRPKAPGSMLSAPMVAVIGLLVALAAGTLLLQATVLAPATERYRAEQLDNQAARLAVTLQHAVDLMHQVVDDAADAPAVVSALLDDTPHARDSLENQLSAVLPHAMRVRITPVGEARLALDESPPLSFAGVEMMRRAEAGATTRPEGLRLDGPLPLFNLARPVVNPDTDSVVGTLLVTFRPTMISDTLARLDIDRRGVVLEQVTRGGETVPIILLGRATDNLVTTRIALEGADWTLEYGMTPGALTAAPFALVALVPAGLLILVLAIMGIGLGYRRLARNLDADLATLLQSTEAVLAGRAGSASPRFRLAAVARAAAALAETVRPARPAAEPHKPEPADSSSAAPPLTPTREQPALPPDDFLEILDDEGAGSIPDAGIFRAYDIRGVVGESLTENGAFLIGRAIGSEAAAAGEKQVVVGADGRHSSPALRARISAGILESGVDVLDIGEVPTPILYFATHVTQSRSGVMITGSHNPPEYNGFKIVIDGATLAGERIMALHERIVNDDFATGTGTLTERDMIPEYIDRIASDVALAQPMKVVVDCGNGIAGKVIPSLLEALGCEVLPLYCDVDGSFPNHHPDPADPANMEDLITVVKAEQADIGLAFDGDGDRLGVVTESGAIIWPDRLLMLFARDIVSRNPGADVIFDVKCSRHLNRLVAEYGGRPIMWRTGHSHIKAKMKETGALLGGEFSGHICFGERWYGFDDGLYSATRLLEILSIDAMSASEVFAEFPDPVSTPELKIATTDDAKFRVIEALAAGEGFGGGGDLNTIDGIRVDYPDGWGLIRASNTSPVLTLRFEADDEVTLKDIQQRFRSAIQRVDPDLDF